MAEMVSQGLAENVPMLVDLLAGLHRLDTLLEAAIAAAAAVYGAEAAQDRFRGLYVTRDQAERLLARGPGESMFWHDDLPPLAAGRPEQSRLAWLKLAYDLSDFDVDVLFLALAPELDRRYERLYAYLQDHVSQRRPSVDLALHLLCPDAAARLARRGHFDSQAPLIRHGLLHLSPEPGNEQPSLLAHTLILDEQIVRFLLHQDGLDGRLTNYCVLEGSGHALEELPLPVEVKRALPAVLRSAWEEYRPLRLYFRGPPGAGKRAAAAAAAAEIGALLLVVDLARALQAGLGFTEVLQLVFRYAWLYSAIVYLDGVDVLDATVHAGPLLSALAQPTPVAILAGNSSWLRANGQPVGTLEIPFAIPGFAQRQACWQANLADADAALDSLELDTLSSRFRLLPGQIAAAAGMACEQLRWQVAGENGGAAGRMPVVANLFAAARAQSGHDLAALARKIEPSYTWDDIVLPADTLDQLREVCQRVVYRQRVLGEWGFDQKLALGKGIHVLFSGPSGTGKTMAAEIIAGELGLDLYRIDLSGVVSKYIGETEKNLDRIFTAAENANAILFFDEADALFGKRSEVRDSHDRYANIEISYLLQKMEEYDGVSILATNLRQNLDDAFIRRLTFAIHFPFPDEASRGRIWQGVWPQQTPLAQTVALAGVARQFKLSGGNIKNAALAAAFLAAADGGQVTLPHLLQAIRREYQKMGKGLSAAEMNGLGEVTERRAR